jgi:hypothetical protein
MIDQDQPGREYRDQQYHGEPEKSQQQQPWCFKRQYKSLKVVFNSPDEIHSPIFSAALGLGGCSNN